MPLVLGDPPALVRSHQEAVCPVSSCLPAPGLERLELRFDTPLRLLRNGRLEEEVPFHVLVRALLRRASSLLEFHEGIDLDLDFKGLIEEAERVEQIRSDLTRTDRVRFSARQQRTMNLVGVRGSVAYSGQLDRFRPLLALGLALGVGKGTTFGLGRMRMLTT
ncbi:MAG: CRISPR system precrRNA processing endoribonuclease RAMP protein Cas6 [Planctomycetota bacterium]